MLDNYRRRTLTRIVLDNELTADDCTFMQTATALVEEAKAPPPVLAAPCNELAYAEKILCAVGKKIPAIKSVKDRTGLGLKDAKDMVDEYCRSRDYHERAASNGGY